MAGLLTAIHAAPRRAWRPLLLASVAAVFALIILGGVVRVTGAGLACPDWPLCQGRIVPPLEGPIIIEYSHRLLASLASILMVAVAVLTLALQRRRTGVLVLGVAAAGLLVVQVVLGGVAVLLELPPTVVTAHLGIAEALFGALIVLYLTSRPAPPVPAAPAPAGMRLARFRRLAIGAAATVYLLILSGAYVRGAGAALACGTQWPLCPGGVLPAGEPALVHMAHRLLALAVGLHVLFTAWRGFRLGLPGSAGASAALAGLLVAQVIVGAANPWTSGAAWVQAAHLALGTALWGGAVALATISWRAGARSVEPTVGASLSRQGAE